MREGSIVPSCASGQEHGVLLSADAHKSERKFGQDHCGENPSVLTHIQNWHIFVDASFKNGPARGHPVLPLLFSECAQFCAYRQSPAIAIDYGRSDASPYSIAISRTSPQLAVLPVSS